MKCIPYTWLAAGILAALLAATSVAQNDASLGDYARQARKQKAQQPTTTKQFDNDTLPKSDKLSVVGAAPADGEAKPADDDTPAVETAANQAEKDSTQDDQADSTKADDKPGDSAEDRQKAYQEWKDKINNQKAAVDLAGRELDVLQREYRLRAAAFYADAGNRLRSAGSWDKEDAQYKQQIADKQKAVDAAKKALDQLQESARKAGVPSSMRQ